VSAAKRSLTLEQLGDQREAYFESCLKIEPKDVRLGMIPLALKKEQKRLGSIVDHERRQGRPPKVVILKSRRIGASTWTEAELFRECHTKHNRKALVVANDTDSADIIFRMSQLFYDNLPPSAQPELRYATKKLLDFKHNNSRMQVIAAGGRGFAATHLHISELAWIADADELMTALLQTVPDTPDTLVVAESTPNGVGNYFHNLWVNAVAKKNDWVPFFSPWFEDETAHMTPWFEESDLTPHDLTLVRTHNLSLRQIAWYISVRENKLNGDQDKMDQEYPSDPITCFLASGRKVFDAEHLRFYMDAAAAAEAAGELPPEVEIEANPNDKHSVSIRVVRRGRWRIYRPPQPRYKYIVGVDTASGDPGGDFTPIVVLNRHTLDVDAVFYARLDPDLLAQMAGMIAWWYNGAKIAGEANNHGVLFFDTLLKRVQYHNVYYRLVDEKSVTGKVSEKPGFWTSDANRAPLFDLGRQYVRNHAGRCIDPSLLKEWTEMFYADNNRIDHPKGGYIDGTQALCMAVYVHHGSYEGTLAPLPLEMTQAAVSMYRDNRVRRSMGIPEQEIDIGRLTMDQIQALDNAEDRRKRLRERTGLGGTR
jgi:hypothetical protein